MLCVFASVLAVASVAGCGGGDDGLPDGAVAEVGGTVITQADFERAVRFATGRGHDPRDYAACVAAKRRPAGEAGGTQPDEADLEQRCREEYEQIKGNVMNDLIEAEWTRQEAEARDVVVTDAQVKRAIDEAQEGGLFDRKTLSRAGMSERELLRRVSRNQLQAKVKEQLTEQARKISAHDVADYYRRNKTELIVPDRREMRIVITRSRARAQAARTALDAGRSWKSVATEYSLHSSRNRGGRITAESRRKSTTGLGAAIFAAKRGELMGPVGDDDTWAVFVVDKIKPSHQPTLEQARDEITERLQSARAKRAIEAYTKKYRDKTTCAPGFRVRVCKNGPKGTDGPPGQ